MAERRVPGLLQSGVRLHRRMARACRRAIAGARSCFAAGIRRAGAPRHTRRAYAGRLGLAVAAFLFLGSAQAQLLSARMWPAREYTRLTLESKEELKYTIFTIKDPQRVVLDLEVAELPAALSDLPAKVSAEDPHVQALRVAKNRPGVVRLVLEVKGDGTPQVFSLPPIGEYGHRLVLDIQPLVPFDPLAQLIEETEKRSAERQSKGEPAPPPKDKVARLATVVIDAGHGGEDPGARGRRGSREKDVTLTIARRLKALVDAEPNMRALLTRDGDYFLPLNVRVEKARKVRADLFVSIHADSFTRSNVRGSSVFALSDKRATSELARALAKKENESDLIGGVALNVKDDHVR